MSNCPNCGAVITSWKCEYCDTVFEEPKTRLLYTDNMPYMSIDDYEYMATRRDFLKRRLTLQNNLVEHKTRNMVELEEIKSLYETVIADMRKYAN